MKNIMMAVSILLAVGAAQAAEPVKKASAQDKICGWAQSVVDLECAHIMCDDEIKNGTFKDIEECTSGDEYEEAAQAVCEDQPTTVDGLINQFNKSHNTTYQCEQ